MKSKTVAAILALFLGGLGIHQFYLGNNLRGFLYLIFSWTLIPTLLALIDFVIILCMNDNKFNMLYNCHTINFPSQQVIQVNVNNNNNSTTNTDSSKSDIKE